MKHFYRTYKLPLLFFFLPWTIYFLLLWSHILFYENGNLMAGHPYVWADWSMHIALASNFAFRPMTHWFDSLPVYSGVQVTYPFVINLLSGLLWRAGVSLPNAFIFPSFILSIGSLIGLYAFFSSIFKNQKQAMIAATIFLCSGGLGVFLTFRDKGIEALLDSTQILTQISDYHIEVNSILPSMLVPQRAFLLGLPIGIAIIWILLNEFVFSWKKKRDSYLIVAGILAGLMPILHTHTFLLLVLFSGWLFAWKWQSFYRWMLFGVPSVLLSLLVYFIFLRRGVSPSSFFLLNIGWSGKGSFIHWLIFWWENWGLFLPLAIVGTGILYLERKWNLLYTVTFFWVLFFMANIVQFQPQEWDNTKMFAWVYFGLSIPVTTTLFSLVHIKIKYIPIVVCAVLTLILIASGGIDILHNLDRERKTFQMLSADQITLGTFAREHTDPTAVFLTRPIVTNPISMMGGRSVYLGYPGWAFSYGLDFGTRENEITDIFAGDKSLDSIKQLKGIGYIYIDKDETDIDWILQNPSIQKVYENPAGSIYAVR